LRWRRRERLGHPPHNRTLRHPLCFERDRGPERDDHRPDTTTPDNRGHADLDPNSDHGRASQLAHDHTGDVG
jgi:hypothetical protein